MLHDMRYAVRSLRKSPAFAAAAIVSVALGVGANTAIFSLLDAVVLRPLPVKAPASLVAFGAPGKSGAIGTAFSYPFYRSLADHRAFTGVLAYTDWAAKLGSGGEARRVSAELVTPNYFELLGVRLPAGRGLGEAEAAVVLSHPFWQRHFAGDPGAIGKQVTLNDAMFAVAGVAPPDFFGTEVGSAPDLWVALTAYARVNPGVAQQAARPQTRWLRILARLAPGVGRAQAEAAVNLAARDLPPEMRPARLVLLPSARGLSGLRRQLEKPLSVLMAGVALLLLIACTNVANLAVARAAARQRETAVRLALGAGRARLVRQAVTESTLLALAGGVVALPLAVGAGRALVRFLPASATLDLAPDWRVFGFAFAVSLISGVLFGLAPALQSATPGDTLALRDQAGGSSHFRLRGALVVAQVALCFLLLAAAGLFVRTLRNLEQADPGFTRDSVVVAWLDLSLSGLDRQRGAAAVEELAGSVAAQPAVLSAAAGAYGALSGGERNETVDVPGRPPHRGEDSDFNVVVSVIGSGYFTTLGIPLTAGRDFAPQDRAGAPRVAILSESSARDLFAHELAVGRRIVPRWLHTEVEVIGVARDAKYVSLRDEARRTLYLPNAQEPGARIVYARTRDTNAAVAAIRREARERNLPVSRIRTLAVEIEDRLRQERLLAIVSGCFGGLALLLAAVGLYGLMAYSVARRRREIGIRVALGAQRSKVLTMVLGQGLKRIGIGLAIGVPAALALSRFATTLLYGVDPNDAATLAGAGGLLTVCALAAVWIPALAATRIDPATSLRQQ